MDGKPVQALQASLHRIQQQQQSFVESLQVLQANHENLQKNVANLLVHLDHPAGHEPVNDMAPTLLRSPEAVDEGKKNWQQLSGSEVTVEVGFHSDESQKDSYACKDDRNEETKQHMLSKTGTMQSKTGMTSLQKWRQVIIRVVNTTAFELGASLVIVLNLITIGIQTELSLSDIPIPWMNSVERSFLFVYTVECVLRFLARGPKIFRSLWFLLDFFLVVVGLFFLVALPLLNFDFRDWDKVLVVRGLRLLRLARALRLLGSFSDVWRLVYGIVNSSLTIISSAMLAFLMLYIFGCMAIEFITKDARLVSDEGNGNIAEIDALPELLAAVEALDVDSNGILTEQELLHLPIDTIPPQELKKVSVRDMAELFHLLDVHERGVLTQSEFMDGLLDLVVLDVPMWSRQSLRFLRVINDRLTNIQRDVDTLKHVGLESEVTQSRI
eukprot:Skav227716  [mRNA]  locus=scaffold802:25093:28424:- [translate_table: standard]